MSTNLSSSADRGCAANQLGRKSGWRDTPFKVDNMPYSRSLTVTQLVLTSVVLGEGGRVSGLLIFKLPRPKRFVEVNTTRLPYRTKE